MGAEGSHESPPRADVADLCAPCAAEEEEEEEEEEAECAICLNTRPDRQDRLALPCGHGFCRPCILQALATAPRCPLCKVAVPSDAVARTWPPRIREGQPSRDLQPRCRSCGHSLPFAAHAALRCVHMRCGRCCPGHLCTWHARNGRDAIERPAERRLAVAALALDSPAPAAHPRVHARIGGASRVAEPEHCLSVDYEAAGTRGRALDLWLAAETVGALRALDLEAPRVWAEGAHHGGLDDNTRERRRRRRRRAQRTAGQRRMVIPPPPVPTDAEFRRCARRGHWKRCPSCGSAIEKTAGCDRVVCRCGHRFNWQEARTVVPCSRVHYSNGLIPAWGSVCPGCSPLAKAKLAAARAGVLAAGSVLVPAAVGVAGGVVGCAAAIAAVPAAIFGPLALAAEPVRQLFPRSRRPKPYLAHAAASGAYCVGAVCLHACVCDDDD